MTIEIVNDNKKSKDYWGLLLDADPSEAMIDRYLDKGDMFVMKDGSAVICVAVAIGISDTVCELKNIATAVDCRNQGYASKMIDYLLSYYAPQYGVMQVGTSQSGVEFYEKLGFIYSHTVKNFFKDNYHPQPLEENGVPCVDMIYLKKSTK